MPLLPPLFESLHMTSPTLGPHLVFFLLDTEGAQFMQIISGIGMEFASHLAS
jgi:hypothetical protein